MNKFYANQYQDNNGQYMVCYTFDAGPNAVLVVRDTQCLNIMINAIQKAFFNENENEWIEDKLKLWDNKEIHNIKYPELKGTGIEKVILTQISDGAQVIHARL